MLKWFLGDAQKPSKNAICGFVSAECPVIEWLAKMVSGGFLMSLYTKTKRFKYEAREDPKKGNNWIVLFDFIPKRFKLYKGRIP